MKSKNILILVAHTDDETIGCGGTICKHIEDGYKVFAMSFTDGVSARSTKSKILKKDRNLSAKKASKFLGFKWIKNLNFPDNQLDKIPLLKIIKEIEKIKNKIKPSIVYTHNFTDLNIDHKLIAEATLTAFRPTPDSKLLELRTFEVPSATDYSLLKHRKNFVPNLFVDISKFWKKKINALKIYKTEIKKKPHSRSYEGITNLAKIRGNQSGLKFAEGFEIIRKIYK
tara:strand:+ start:7875 stop:8555 length:681 start_codon:yes stop_codon:yes gene_type:complete